VAPPGCGLEGLDAEDFEGLEVGDAREQNVLELGAGLGIRRGVGGLLQPLEKDLQGLDRVFGSTQAQYLPPLIDVDAKRFTGVASRNMDFTGLSSVVSRVQREGIQDRSGCRDQEAVIA
jgi:hypothetical protein